MRQKLALLAGGLAVGVVVARLLRRRRATRTEAPIAQADPRAEALRRQLSERRRDGAEAARVAPGDPASLDDARREVHEHGRAVVDEMRRQGDL